MAEVILVVFSSFGDTSLLSSLPDSPSGLPPDDFTCSLSSTKLGTCCPCSLGSPKILLVSLSTTGSAFSSLDVAVFVSLPLSLSTSLSTISSAASRCAVETPLASPDLRLCCDPWSDALLDPAELADPGLGNDPSRPGPSLAELGLDCGKGDEERERDLEPSITVAFATVAAGVSSIAAEVSLAFSNCALGEMSDLGLGDSSNKVSASALSDLAETGLVRLPVEGFGGASISWMLLSGW